MLYLSKYVLNIDGTSVVNSGKHKEGNQGEFGTPLGEEGPYIPMWKVYMIF